jgi:HK97 family phage prohead protease
MILEQRNFKIEDPELETRTEASEDGAKYILGYAALVNSQSRPITETINGRQETFIETIDSRAFDNAAFEDVVYLIDHDPSKMVGRQGANLEVKKTEKGLFFRAKVIDTTLSKDLYVSIQERLYKDNSFSFRVAKDEWSRKDGQLYRTIKEIRSIHDVSTTIKGAYAEPFVFTRSLDENQIQEITEAPVEIQPNDLEKDSIEFDMLKLKGEHF